MSHDWRNDPATDRQREYARVLGASVPKKATKGHASIIIEKAEAKADKGPPTQQQIEEASDLGVAIPRKANRGQVKALVYEARRVKSEKERIERHQKYLEIYGYLLSEEEFAASKRPTGPYGRHISSHTGRRPCHAMQGTFDPSYFVNPETNRFCFPKYKHDRRYLVKIKDTTNYREEYWDDYTKEERDAYTFRDFENEAHCFELEVDSFDDFAVKPGSPYLGDLKPLRDDVVVAEELIESLHFGEFCFLDDKSEKILTKHGYVFKRDIVSGEDKQAILADLSMSALKDIARPHGIKLGGKKVELRQRLIDSGIDYELPSCYVASPKLMAWYGDFVNAYVSEIKKNAERFHPLYHEFIWDSADCCAEYSAVEIKLDAIRRTEYWLNLMTV